MSANSHGLGLWFRPNGVFPGRKTIQLERTVSWSHVLAHACAKLEQVFRRDGQLDVACRFSARIDRSASDAEDLAPLQAHVHVLNFDAARDVDGKR